MTRRQKYRTGKSAIIYTRVSDVSQVLKGHSIKEQEPILRKFASEQGYSVKRVFSDKGKSATSTVGREELMKALVFAEDNKDVSALVIVDTDRLARSENDHFTIRSFLKKHGIKLLSRNQPGIDDSIEGRLMDGIMASVNAFQSRMTGRKVSTILQRLAEQGKPTGPAPLGYLNVNTGTAERPNREVILDPKTSPLVHEVFELYSTGNFSITDIAELMNKRGLRSIRGSKIYRSTLANIFSNPYYIGKLKHCEKLYEGRHTPLISDTLFQKCKNVLAEHNQYAIRKRIPENHTKFFLRGFLRCGICGHRVTGSHLKYKEQDYYYCSVKKGEKGFHSNRGQTVAIEEIEKQIFKFFSLLELSSDVIGEVLERAKEILIETHSGVDREKERLVKQNTTLERQRQVLEVKLLDGVISDETYSRQHERVDNEISENSLRISEIGQKRQSNTQLFESLAKLAHNLPSAYRQSAPEVKMMYLNIFWDNFEMRNRTITKAVPSKIVTSMINDKLIKLKENTSEQRVLIKFVWLLGLDSNQ